MTQELNSSSFFYKGTLSASKSLLNRALIVQSHDSNLKIRGDSHCSDVFHMKDSLQKWSTGHLNAGEGGTTFRFLAIRASREKRPFVLEAHTRIFERPQKDLEDVLQQLHCKIEKKNNSWILTPRGWESSQLKVSMETSSQFLSGLFLNSWNLPFDFQIQVEGERRSESYLKMTLSFLRSLGMHIQETHFGYTIPSGQKLKTSSYDVEPDLSSAFSVAAIAALMGEAHLQFFPKKSLQPDQAFIEILKKMGVNVQRLASPYENQETLIIPSSKGLSPIKVSLASTPDLFPVLAVLCSFASGTSELMGAPHLKHKESNRILKTSELLTLFKVPHEILEDGMKIQGISNHAIPIKNTFDPDEDHRMAMAAGIFKKKLHALNFQILNSTCVDKSFPEFWSILGEKP